MKIDRNAHVTLTYELRLENAEGELIEQTGEDTPLQFVFGAGKMLEMFEQKLEGMAAGDQFAFGLKADEAYGEMNPNAIVEIPKHIFEINGKIDENLLVEGNNIPMQDAHGNRLNGLVLEVGDELVKMDFNHPLAGEDLFFNGKIVEVREATEDELAACCGDGCNSGGCGSGSSGGCGCGC
jgi:FKBP-type peptidyl-prolyl cis-trans isomerase SlyD